MASTLAIASSPASSPNGDAPIGQPDHEPASPVIKRLAKRGRAEGEPEADSSLALGAALVALRCELPANVVESMQAAGEHQLSTCACFP